MKPINDISLPDVKTVMEKKGYEVSSSEGVPNIIGIRNSINSANWYDDRCFVWWKEDGNEVAHFYTITTHPGFYWLAHPMRKNGAAILVPNQYKNCWTLGMHREKQFALCQTRGEVRVYRDNLRDGQLTCDPSTIQSGYFGIDLHHGALNDVDVIDKYSAGCQVWRYAEPHEVLMDKFKALSAINRYDTFSYTLLLQEDFS